MKTRILSFFVILFAVGGLLFADDVPKPEEGLKPEAVAEEAVKDETAKADEPKRQVEVVFLLDSTGSMGGLIEGAKQKIWAIANEIILQEPQPEVKIGLLTYRDLGDEYVTKMFDLTTDIDAIFGHLQSFQANGGGDTPESVNQALNEAVTKMSWADKEKDVYRVVFLVGDAPPHMDYQDDVKYPESCKLALERNIIINTVQCGNISECTPIWEEIAKSSEGNFSRIMQSGNVVVVESPYDAEIEGLTRELNETVISYGSVKQQAEVAEKLKVAESSPKAAKADRAYYNVMTKGTAVMGAGDLVVDGKENNALLEKTEELPEIMQKMTLEERQKYVQEQSEKRGEINKKLGELTTQRSEWLATEGKKKRLEVAAERRAGETRGRAAYAAPMAPATPMAADIGGAHAHGGLGDAADADAAAEVAAPAEMDSFDETVADTIREQMNRAPKE